MAKTPWSPPRYRPRGFRFSARTRLHYELDDGRQCLFSVRSWWTRQLVSTHIFPPSRPKACLIPCLINLPKASTSTSKSATNISASARAFFRAWVFRATALEVALMDLLENDVVGGKITSRRMKTGHWSTNSQIIQV